MEREPIATEPDAELAAMIAAEVIGHPPAKVRRFTTGVRHYVFDVEFAGRPPVVVRIGNTSAQSEMAGAAYLSGLLRPRGVPLPAILAQDLEAQFPWLVVERLPGTDLGEVIGSLSSEHLERIAVEIARAQAITAEIGSAGRYGYGVLPEQAPYTAWSQVLDANLARSRRRIASAGLFDIGLVDIVQTTLTTLRDEVDAITPTPFLHDTTTKNVIATAEGGFSGIVDVDDLCFGDPRYPAALTLAALMGYGGPIRYIAAWLRHAGQADDRIFRLYVSLFLLDLMSEHGQIFNGNVLPSTTDARAALHRAFESSIG